MPETEKDLEQNVQQDQEPEQMPETAAEAAPEATEATEEAAAADPCEKLQAELAQQKDQYLRLMAEYQNYRNRTTEEKKKIYGDAKADAVKELLNVADTFDRAVAMECADETYKKGVEMTYAQLQKAFEKLGIAEISPLGQEFDPNLHNAIRQSEGTDYAENTVCEVYQKGYTLGDRLIRPAVVAVAI